VEIVALDAFSPADTVSAASGGSFGDAVTITDASNNPLTLNRTTSDGDIQVFKKDGTTVGSIGTRTGRIKIGDGDCGLFFDDTNNRINPEGPDNTSANDAAIDLGGSTQRFKNLYLSGGVYLGGTGAANYLDDFEEGSWTPTLSDNFNNSVAAYDRREGTYTKIGDRVIATCNIDTNTKGASLSGTVMRISNLPFTPNGSVLFQSCAIGYWHNVNIGTSQLMATVYGTNTFAYLFYTGNNVGSIQVTPSEITDNTQISATMIYKTDS